MMKYLQRLGKSLMLPVACLPVAGILMGIGYWIDPSGWGANNVVSAFLIKAGGSIIDNMAILFAIGVAVGMAKDNDGTAALAGLVSWLVITTLLSSGTVAMFTGAEADPAFGKIQTQFIGILCGLLGSSCYNKFRNTRLPDFLAFFSGKRSVAIITAGVSIVVSLILFFVWPVVYGALVAFGTAITSTGAIGAGIYGFLNRLLIPFGLHHALNSVFWFDVANINDLSNFWSGEGTLGVTGIYMSGFFPVMMFGLPAGALAMYHTAKTNKKKVAASLLMAAALCSFFTGVTEPLEFAFMFLAPGLYLIHAGLTGISAFVVALLPTRAGFNFSAGFVDWFLSFRAPMAVSPWLLIPIGLVFAVVYYFVFRFAIVKFNLKTPGREDDDYGEEEMKASLSSDDFGEVAATIMAGLGG
ncbi:MAG TPA: PTS transporter subunit EIIC, partial [Clostridiales bacterium]|nr:PTS transporter subunit EIIC [Clostridiales bacterium]